MDRLDILLFAVAILAYGGAVFCYESDFVLKRARLREWGTRCLVAGAILHAGAILTRSWLLQHLALNTLFEALSFYALVVVVLFLVVQAVYRLAGLGAFVAPLALLFATFALFHPSELRPLGPVLQQTEWQYLYPTVHILIAFLTYAFFTVAFVAAVIYLLQERELKSRQPRALYFRLPPLQAAHRLSLLMVALGFPALMITIVTGAVWNQQAAGAYWDWSAKQTLSLGLLVVYVAYLLAHGVIGWSGRRAAWLLVIGFIGLIVTFVGVNLFAVDVHRF